MGKIQRTKGQVGEREAAGLIGLHTGWAVQRRVRNAAGDSVLVGVPGWSVEIKRYASATRSDISGWWSQCVAQSGSELPVLFYRLDRGSGEVSGHWLSIYVYSTQSNGEPMSGLSRALWLLGLLLHAKSI